ncbi:hypothetical protein PIB30_086615 [Stylosanthes scabra]|uniref:Uncharacterized protein n=1 Tax=Stylosanthes scabra TaxID=79078 RepID=A0ABU6RTV2_9FABA|nr:hypothetical protein [Stylosanthes scabra]
MDEVLQVIGKEGATWWDNPRNPIIRARPKKKILNKEEWMWLKLIVCNIIPTKHETSGESISLPSVMNYTMNADPTESKNQLLPYPMFITKWAQQADVPRYSGDEILKIPKSQQFFPFEKWIGDDEEAAPPTPPEQLMLRLHPELDTSGLEQIFSLKVSQAQHEQATETPEVTGGDEEEDDEF